MAIHERGHRRLQYVPTSWFERVWPIAMLELRTMFKIRFGAILFLGCLLPTIGSLIMLLVRSGIWEMSANMRGPGPMANSAFDPSQAGFFLRPILFLSFVPALIMTTLVSVRAVAKDRAAGALEIYWTRAISPAAYFFGKWLGSFLLLALAFVAAPFVLWVTSVLLAPDWQQFELTIGKIPRILVATTVLSALITLLAVSLSAAVSTPNFASILWLFLMVGSLGLSQVLRFITKQNWVVAMNPWRAAKRIVEWIAADEDPFFNYSPLVAVLILALMLGVLGTFAARRLRVLDAVAT
jgi:putative exporter of polyketide antibiotics